MSTPEQGSETHPLMAAHDAANEAADRLGWSETREFKEYDAFLAGFLTCWKEHVADARLASEGARELSQNEAERTHPCRDIEQEESCTSVAHTTEARDSEGTPSTPATAPADATSSETAGSITSTPRAGARTANPARGTSSLAATSGKHASEQAATIERLRVTAKWSDREGKIQLAALLYSAADALAEAEGALADATAQRDMLSHRADWVHPDDHLRVVNRAQQAEGALAPAAACPVCAGHAAEEDVAERVVAVDEAVAGAVSDSVVAGGLDDLADHDGLGAIEAGDGDFNPVADVELHTPISTAWGSDLTPVCGICGWTIGCDCGSRVGFLSTPEQDFDPYVDDFGHELECTHCNGDGECEANNDPLWDCDDQPHPCHACNGSGKRRDQVIF